MVDEQENMIHKLKNSTILYKKFNDEGMDAMQINRLVTAIFEDESLSYLSVTYHLKKKSFIPKNKVDNHINKLIIILMSLFFLK